MKIVSTIRSAMKRYRDSNPELDYLNEATSCADLECREREITRGRFRNQRRMGF
ncbi:hypothetical protein [Consotaella salsifontis]|uniref:DUF3563 domain-containing protein n=1 Tax=Consotaella salsifontis TaxID=1365950 RepID=A0A1T4RD17_9HYPH|nr:hypothetical protein [Consotaella salsifontis]SKA13914.1 hypothetical protein SAMN05428963_106220 [Consotaella salsifontis]